MLKAVNEELLDYTSFVSLVLEKISERMGKNYQVSIYKVVKNNSLELDSLVVLKEGKTFAPNIYLNAYYESYKEGTSIMEIIDRLNMIYSHCAVPLVQDDFEYSLETLKPYIFFRLVSKERNKKLLKKVPYIDFLDLAVTFHCLVRSEEDGIATIRITNDHIKLWDISSSDLKELAFKNTRELFPPIIKSMDEVINAKPDKVNTYIENSNFHKAQCDSYPMYIVTNEKGIYGASCLLYKGLIKDFAQKIKSDLYILPSSIHEIILIPIDKRIDKDYLKKMVMEINKSSVPMEEVLSDNVYIYSRRNNAFIM